MKYAFVYLSLLMVACAPKDSAISFVVTNELAHQRSEEVIEVPSEWIALEEGESIEQFGIADETGQWILVQYQDDDQDGIADVILFQPSVPAKAQAKYFIKALKEGDTVPTSESACFSRFVPERTDDYAWENDKVAFRMFGPTAQQMKEEGVSGGTLTSGIDCWLKRVEYPIINKWYKEYESYPNAYHEDTGEGLDNFHVGISRGCGGIAVKSGETFYTSKNYTVYRTLANGSMRTAFELDFAPWEAGESGTIQTKKSVNLDRSCQLSKIEVGVAGSDNIWVGLTLHENDGQVTVDSIGGWVSYHQPHGDSYLATAVVAAPGTFLGSEVVETEEADLSHAYLNLAVEKGRAIYYTGFYWQKSGQFEDKEAWESYLSLFTAQLASPLGVALE